MYITLTAQAWNGMLRAGGLPIIIPGTAVLPAGIGGIRGGTTGVGVTVPEMREADGMNGIGVAGPMTGMDGTGSINLMKASGTIIPPAPISM